MRLWIPKPKPKGGHDVLIKPTPISYCQSCLRDFRSQEIVYFAPVDNTVICADCAKAHKEPEPRIYGKEA